MNTANNTQFQIHQINLRDISDEINRLGWTDACAKYEQVQAHLDYSCSGSRNRDGENQFKAEHLRHYDHVATIEATGLENVFEIGNIGPESKITRILPMHSISVGDIVQSGGLFWMCEPCGFVEITDIISESLAVEPVDPTRYAVIDCNVTSEVGAYLPSGYEIVGIVQMDGSSCTLIKGLDHAGWTLDGYVLPRLGSGWLHGNEITADEADQLVKASALDASGKRASA